VDAGSGYRKTDRGGHQGRADPASITARSRPSSTKKPYEITTLRKDIETDGRRAVVSFTEDWREDAQRRDFTINTLLADPQGNIYDPTGEGLKDMEARRVRFVGDPATRIREDYLRILRFFRFHATYGKGAPDKDGLKACRAAADKIPNLSKERITQEFMKILSVDNPVDILSVMFDNSILTEFQFSRNTSRNC
jgi:poly(A) polymerase